MLPLSSLSENSKEGVPVYLALYELHVENKRSEIISHVEFLSRKKVIFDVVAKDDRISVAESSFEIH